MKLSIVPVLIVAFVGVLVLNPAPAKAEVESWYTYWGIGYGHVMYPDKLQSALDMLDEVGDVSHISVALDILGFYWTLSNERTIVGGIINGVGDRYEVKGEELQVNLYLVGPSVIHSFGDEPGSGFFVRGDAGVAFAVVQSSVSSDGRSEYGFGALGGGGYGFAITEGTRLLLNLNYAVRRIESETYGVVGISLGGLF